jgi:hypothetical protein
MNGGRMEGHMCNLQGSRAGEQGLRTLERVWVGGCGQGCDGGSIDETRMREVRVLSPELRRVFSSCLFGLSVAAEVANLTCTVVLGLPPLPFVYKNTSLRPQVSQSSAASSSPC